MKNERIKFHLEGYDYCYTGLETTTRYLISKYKVKDRSGELLPVIDWIIDLEWVSKEYINRNEKLIDLGIN